MQGADDATVDELVAVSKQKPGTLSYLTASIPCVVYMDSLKQQKGGDWVRVPFKGGGEAVNAIMSGSTPIALFGEGNVIGNIQAGQMTPLVMMNNIRSPNFPDVPTLNELGFKDFEAVSWHMIVAPAGMVDKILVDFRQTGATPELLARTAAQGPLGRILAAGQIGRAHV